MTQQETVKSWLSGARDAWDTFEKLFTDAKYHHALFFLHMALEKCLKAIIIKRTDAPPPATHDLLRLAQASGVSLKTAQQSARAFISQLKHAGIPVTHAYLFGSYAKGTATKDSDIDICLLSPVFGKDPIEEMVKLRMISFPIDPRIEPIPVHSDDWNDKYSSLMAEIRKFGKHIV